ncbi:MAG TPA: hypothetical protein VJ914_24110 [Pseudonocardiaceae bacterium]|nr:hypothetical protein [Pseudonocardiaceae bacterium]
MTYGPQPGWNPGQPPVGPQPGYPAQQPGYPTGQQPGYPPPPQAGYPTQPPAGYPQQQQPGFPGQPNPYGAPAAPRPPLLVITGILAFLLFAYLIYNAVIEVLVGLHAGTLKIAHSTSFLYEGGLAIRLAPGFVAIIGGLIAILWLVGGLLFLLRKPASRIIVIIAAVLTIVLGIVAIVRFSNHFSNLFTYFVPAIALIALVLAVLPATSQALRGPAQRQPQGYGPGYPPPGYPQQPGYPPQPGYPQQQPPGGYQQPPGGMPG